MLSQGFSCYSRTRPCIDRAISRHLRVLFRMLLFSYTSWAHVFFCSYSPFIQDPAYEVSVLGLEHHDLPQPTTNADVSSLLLSIGAPISASQPLPSGARSASGGGGSVTSSSNSLGSGPGRGMKSVTALPRDYYSKATAGELYRRCL
jgi:hypothetical protein